MRSPDEHTQEILRRTKEAVEHAYAEIPGRKHTLKLSNVTFGATPAADNYAEHKQVMFDRKTLGTEYFADVTLVDNATGKILDSAKVKLGLIPSVTNRHSFLVNGKEYIVHNQVRLKPGIYTKLDRNENAVADFNLARGANFSLMYLPAKGEMQIEMGGSHIPVYTLLKDVFNVGDTKLTEIFGAELHKQQAGKHLAQKTQNIDKLYNLVIKRQKNPQPVSSEADKLNVIREYIGKTMMDPELNKMTMRSGYDKVTAESVLHAAADVMAIYQNKKDPTWKDNLAFKNVLGTEDFVYDKLTKKAAETKAKMKAKIDLSTKIKDIGISYYFRAMIDDFFVFSDLVNYPMQVNPMEMTENAHKITSLGEGGISSVEALPLDARNNHSSELGFIDPVRTPDNLRAGVDNRIAIGAVKAGTTLLTFAKTPKGAYERVSPQQLYNKIYAFDKELPDNNGLYNAFYQGHMIKVTKDKIQYFLPGNTMFTVSTASIPFLENTHPQRAAMGAKMLTQALSLTDRELPIVTTSIHDSVTASTMIPKAAVTGQVVKIEPEKIQIKDSSGKIHDHHIPHNFPLNYHSYIHADPVVKVGDKVEQGQQLAEHNFSKDGKLALGKNLKVAFLPYKGYNYEDAIVVTETGAKKLGSQHIFQEEMEIPEGQSTVVDTDKFRSYFPNKFTVQQLSMLDKGVVKKGTILHNGDPIITAIRSKRESPEVAQLGKMSARFANPFNDESRTWTRDYPGEVIEVVRRPNYIKVVIKATAPLVVADKLCNRYGGKGVVSLIVPDAEAPRNSKGEVPDVFLNPAGLPSRKNVSQVFETISAKVVKEKGLPQIKHDFFADMNTYDKVAQFAKQHGVSDTETYIDPTTGKKIEGVMDGYQYMLKLHKQAESSFAARAGGKYDIDLRPIKGGEEGAKNVGALEFYGFLAHKGGSRNLLREAATYKAEYNPEVWKAILTGKEPPPPKPTFAYEKFLTMLKGAGINVQKEGPQMKVLPFTDQDVLKISNGEIQDGSIVMSKPDPVTNLPFRPETGGLFDPKTTGGLIGKQWGHVTLQTPVVNPMFEKPVRALLGLKTKDFDALAHGEQHVTIDGKEMTGGLAIREMLKKIDRDKEIVKLQQELETTTSLMKRDTIIKKLKYLKALQGQNIMPHEAYTIQHVPIIPPQFRPIYPQDDGRVVVSDINHIYSDLIKANNELKSPVNQALGSKHKDYKELYQTVYEGVKKIQGLDKSDDHGDVRDREPVGFLKTIIGNNQVKHGYFQSKLLSKSQDIVGRGVVAVDPSLGMDQLGLPEPMAWVLYGPFVIGQLVKNGYTTEKAMAEVEQRTQMARNVLIAEMKSRPIIAKRDPVLHKFGVSAFNAHLESGKQIKASPLITKGKNLDFDGDTFGIQVPVGQDAIKDAYQMLPSKNLFNPLDRSILHSPGQESILGVYTATHPKQAQVVKTFRTKQEALDAYNKGEIRINDRINITTI